MELVNNWLKGGQDYAMGLRLFLLNSQDATLKRLFLSEAETPFKKKKLVAALSNIANGSASAIVAEKEAAKAAEAANTTTATFLKSWPAERNKDQVLTSLWEEARLLLKEIAALHASLLHLPNDDERRAAAFELLRKDDDLDSVYARRDYYEQHNHLPGNGSDPQLLTDPFLVARRIASLKRYIRRDKGKLEKDKTNSGAAARLQAWVNEYNQYAKRLDQPLITLNQTPCNS